MRKAIWIFSVLLGILASRGASAASYVEGEALVVFKKLPNGTMTAASVERGAESFRLASLAAASGSRVLRAYGALSEAGEGIFALLRSETRTTKELLGTLRARSDVIAASPNRITRALRKPNDPQYLSGYLWGLDAIRAPEAWDLTTGCAEVYVAVADTGIDPSHPDLQENLAASFCQDFSGSPSGYSDRDGHGTHVAGTIGAVGNNGLGVTGVNWTTRLIALKVLGDDGTGSTSWTTDALNHLHALLKKDPALRIAAVNFSLGEYGNTPPSQSQQEAEWWAYRTLDRQDRTVIVVSAGNEGLEVGQPAPYDDPENPNDPQFRRGQYVYPASFTGLDNMIVVGAAASDDSAARFSNWSPTAVHLAAPGVDILSTFPELGSGHLYDWMKGTSMAAPHVTGAAALLASRYPDATASQIKAALLQGANANRNPTATAPTNQTGAKLSRYGYLDVRQALEVLGAMLAQTIQVPAATNEWQIIRLSPDDQGNIPVTITVTITAQIPLIEVRAEGRGMVGIPKVTYGKSAKASVYSAETVSAASQRYPLKIEGKVAKDHWDGAAITALYCRTEGVTQEQTVPLGTDGNGIALKAMTARPDPSTPLIPDPDPNASANSNFGGGGCDTGILALALLLLVPFSLRQKP